VLDHLMVQLIKKRTWLKMEQRPVRKPQPPKYTPQPNFRLPGNVWVTR